MKKLMSFFTTLLFSVLVGVLFAMVLSVSPMYTTGAIFALSIFHVIPNGVMCMGLLSELWTGELLKKLRWENTWLARVPTRNDLVKNNTIHMADIGADPEVLINNTTYPIPVITREDEDLVFGLDKFDTVNTAITDDELKGLPYDKSGSVISQHRETLEENTAAKAAHSLAPNVHTASTPLVLTTGVSNGETNARKMLTPKDLARARKLLTKMKVPKKDRILVLSAEHEEDLLNTDEKFALQYKNMTTGNILNMYGFEIYSEGYLPKYHDVAGVLTKKAFGSADDDVTDQVASIFFYAGRTMQFKGDAIMYNSLAQNDPEGRRSLIGFRLYHMCLPQKQEGFGAFVSAKV